MNGPELLEHAAELGQSTPARVRRASRCVRGDREALVVWSSAPRSACAGRDRAARCQTGPAELESKAPRQPGRRRWLRGLPAGGHEMTGPAGYRSSLARSAACAPPPESELIAMRRAPWRKQGVIMLRPEDVRVDWTRQARIDGRTGCTAGQEIAGERCHEILRDPWPRTRGGAREGSERPDRRAPSHRRHARQDAAGRHDLARRCTTPRGTFQADFILANLDPIRALPMLRVPGTGREPDLNERQIDARRRVHQAMQALGGISSPAGSCVWHVVGLQRSVREWAIRQGWGGRPVRAERKHRGILVAALGMLAAHLGYGAAKRAS